MCFLLLYISEDFWHACTLSEFLCDLDEGVEHVENEQLLYLNDPSSTGTGLDKRVDQLMKNGNAISFCTQNINCITETYSTKILASLNRFN